MGMDAKKSQTVIAEGVLQRLQAIVGDKGWVTSGDEVAPFLAEPRGRYHGRTPIVLKPKTTDEVAAIVTVAAVENLPLVPQGGNTGLVGGQVPAESGDEIIVSLSRMNLVRAFDPENNTITAEAGCVLQDVRQATEDADRLFPLSLASEGSCQIGGNLSTNAGGNAVLRYGSMRDLVLGLEVVLPSGEVWSGLKGLRKDNTGYDLKQLFIGAEGTLGIITAAVLKVFPRPRAVETSLAAVPSPQAAVELLSLARALSGDQVSAFELIPRIGMEFVVRHMPPLSDPIDRPHPWYVLIELSSGGGPEALKPVIEEILSTGVENDLVSDAVVASSQAQAKDLWALRERMSEVQKLEGGSIKHDVSVPVSAIPVFLDKAIAAVTAAIPGIRPVPFGHIGDGNIHFNLSQPTGMEKQAFLDEWERMNRIVHDLVHELDGSISAEHGIGRIKRGELARYKSPVELEMMRAIKRTIDPKGIMNPGRIL